MSIMNQQGQMQDVGPVALLRRWFPILMVAFATAGCLMLLAEFALSNHTIGDEMIGLAIGVLGVAVGIASLVFLRREGGSRTVGNVLIAVWVLIAVGGLVGFVQHLQGPEGGPSAAVDTRTRPPLAPLSFTGLGVVGAAAFTVAREGGKDPSERR